PNGKPFIRIKRASEARGVWRVIVNRTERIQTHVERPVVDAHLHPEGSNLEDALAPVLANPKRPRRERTIEVTDGRLQALDTSTGRSAEWKNLSLKTAISPDSRSPNRLELSAELAGAKEAAPLRLDFSWTGGVDTARPAVTSWDVALETDLLPLTAFAPLLSRVAPDFDLAGTVSSRV